MPPEDEVLPAEEQPLHATASPTIDLPGYIPESDPEEDLKEDNDENPKEDHADYPTDEGDDGDDKDESSNDDEDDDVDIKGDKEEKEHPAPSNSIVVALPAIDQALSAEETEPFETDESAATPPPHPAYRIPSPPLPLILSPLPVSSPLLVSPPLPLAPPPLLVSPTDPLGYTAMMIRLRAEAPYTSHSLPPHIILSHTRADTPPLGTPPLLPIPLPTSSPPLHLLSTDHRADRPEVTLSNRKRLCIALGLRYEVGESLSALTARPPRGAPATDETGLGWRMTNFVTTVRQDTNEIYVRLDDEQTELHLMAGRLNMLYRDRRAYARTALLMKREARMQRTAENDTKEKDHEVKPRNNTTSVTNAQVQAMIDQGFTAALAARDAIRSTNGEDNHNSGTCIRRNERATRECTYPDFMKCQPLNFKGAEGVVVTPPNWVAAE
ncbi:hypothetical protein Tco_1041155 [Tanacetum coccineum]|uniref:Uncharacterized protein n=1 Tax=Tanacetum coccineum TaxID=301880 RepID=A0ABQ5GGV4_9ASTR